MSNELPEGWAEAALSERLAIDVQPGFACGAHNRHAQGIPHLRPMNVSEEGRIDLSNLKFVPKDEVHRDERLLRFGDVLFNNTNSPELVGKTAYYALSEPRAFSNHMTRVRCHPDALDPQFCALVLHMKWMDGYFASICNNHVSQASISRTVLLETPIPLPPLAEQKRIVAKVEALLARVNAARQRLAKVPAILKRFRQAVLATACSGRLSENWRSCENGETYPKDWHSCTLAAVCSAVVDCPHSTPKWTETGESCLRTTNFRPGWLDLSEVRFVSPATYRERILRLEPQAGDVLYSREGGILGIACLMPPNLRACLGQRMMLMRTNERMQPEFLMHVLNSPPILEVVKSLTGGTASPHLNVGDVKAFTVPVPPLPEQREIVRRVEALFKLADAIEKRVAVATQRADKLTQSILAKAFRGELVPTEAELARQEGRDYEPVSVLLERIRAERDGMLAPPKRQARRRKS